ncbi:MAG: hypothetical protein KDK45_13400, partial [Leptospiraceae bacterium]|nr:hypothetical protein [Leptospiraceae bacterium]
LMPNLGFEETIFLQSSDMNVADVYFLPNRKTENQQISLDIYVPKINYSDSGDEKEELHFALVDSIVEGIGERFYAEKISSIHVFSMDKTPKDNKLIPLLELEEYLNSLK